MTIYEFAEGLNGRDYGKEITPFEEQRAKELGFVVVFGYSDDNAEFRGAYDEEIGCYNGGRVYEDGEKYIDAVWCEGEYAWTYKTNIPHATFDIYEEGEKYCKGIVFEKVVQKLQNKFTDEEKKKALELCNTSSCAGCKECPYTDEKWCVTALTKDALDLINRYEERIKNLETDLESAHSLGKCFKNLYDREAGKKNAAIQDYAERLHDSINPDWCKIHKLIDDIKEEMTEGQK